MSCILQRNGIKATALLLFVLNPACGSNNSSSPLTPTYVYDFPITRTSCTKPGDTGNCTTYVPRCASTSPKCMPSSGAFSYACAFAPSLDTGTTCQCYENEERLCYTDTGALGTQTCIVDSDTSAHLNPTCTPIPL